MARREFPKAVKVAAVKRATRDGKLFCEGCNGLVTGRFEIDHIRADGLLGEPTLENARVLCAICHKEKTKSDVGVIAKAKRLEARHLGIRKGSRGFAKREKAQLELTKVVPRRCLYE
jgi:5-methylcytosine-specific restriction endonuclease McrA